MDKTLVISKNSICTVLLCFYLSLLQAQISPNRYLNNSSVINCGSSILERKIFELDQSIKAKAFEMEKQRLRNIELNAKSSSYNLTYVIPVVVHVIHKDKESLDNVPNSKIEKLIDNVNTVFRNAGRGDEYIDANIEFCIQNINRQISDRHFFISTRQDDVEMKLKYGWDANEVLNIYLPSAVNACWINDNCPGAYATLPSSHGNYFDGVTMSAANGGSFNILVHELGHILGLYHIWEGGCLNTNCYTQGDKVCDTPPQSDNTSCIQTQNSCSSDMHSHTGFSGDQNDLTFNSMGSCVRGGFTKGQIDRMRYFLQTTRNSYFKDNNYCGGICPDPIDVWYSTNIDEAEAGVIAVGDTVFFTNQSNKATGYQWFINDSLISVDENFAHVFDSIGNFKITLVGENLYALCNEEYSEIVNVSCLTFASFLVDKRVAKVDSTFNFTNYSESAQEYEWYIDGDIYSNNENISYTHIDSVTEPIRIEVCLKAISNFCTFTDCQEIVILPEFADEEEDCGICIEDCNNELDDDRDGLVDLFDPDCECENNYYKNCTEQCDINVPKDQINIISKWEVEDVFGQGQIITIDVDGDLMAEILIKSKSLDKILVFDPVKKTLEYEIEIPLNSGQGNIASADTDRDGYSEIFVLAKDGYLHRFDFENATANFTHTWQSSKEIDRKIRPFGSGVTWATNFMQYTPAITDFDADGQAEIYLGAQIFRSADGQLVSDPNPDQNINQGIAQYGSVCSSVAASIDGDKRLDLIAGSSIFEYKFDFFNNHYTVGKNPRSLEINGQIVDGVTRTLDFNRDGQLDVLVIASKSIFIYDPIKMELLGEVFEIKNGSSYPASNFSLPAIVDIDNDGWLEIIICDRKRLMILDDYRTGGTEEWGQLDKTIVSEVELDFNTGTSSPTIFDFNADGEQEIIISGFLSSYIYDGQLNLLKEFPCNSGSDTAPVVADLDGDNEAELCMVCFKTLTVFESYGINWSSARSIWNQLDYHITNVNDDGTIPKQKQTHHLIDDSIPVLGSLMQTPILNQENEPLINHGDISLEIIETDCSNDHVFITIKLCRDFEFELTENIYISVYEEDPITHNANKIRSFQLNNDNYVDNCKVFSNAYGPLFNKDIYLFANDQGLIDGPFDFNTKFPKIKYLECDYLNNVDHTRINKGNSKPLDLGEDLLVCGANAYTINVGSGYDNYLWQDGSQDSFLVVNTSGWYSLETWNRCDGKYFQDSIFINLADTVHIDEASDMQICRGQSVEIPMPYFDAYLWSTKDQTICDTCATLNITPTENTIYYFEGYSYPGCITKDSLSVQVVDQIMEEVYVYSNLCKGDTIHYDGVSIDLGSSHAFVFESSYGCDSIVEVFAVVEDYEFADPYPEEFLTICQGDSLRLSANTGDFVRFEWREDGNVICNNCTSIDVNPSSSTTYEVYMFLGWTDYCKVFTKEYNVEIVNDTYNQVEVSSCNGEDYLYNNQILLIDSSYLFNYTTQHGCDSIVEVIGKAQWIELDTFACTGQTITYNDQELNSGSFQEIFWTNEEGCHLAKVNVESLQIYSSAIDTFVCGNETVYFDGFEILPDTEETINYDSKYGCDSIVKVNVHKLEEYFIQIDTSVCESEGIVYNDTLMTAGQRFDFHLKSIHGCDSIISVNVVSSPNYNYRLDTFACFGSSILFDGVTIPAGTSDSIEYYTAKGCDSTFLINVFIDNGLSSYELIDTFVCEGKELEINGTLVGANGLHSEVFSNQYGCDSIVEYEVHGLSNAINLIDTLICEGSSLTFNNIEIFPDEEIEFQWSTEEGCDSIVVVKVGQLSKSLVSIDTFICAENTIEINGELLSVGDEIQAVYAGANSCDSLVNYKVYELETYTSHIDTSICEGAIVNILGQSFEVNQTGQIILETLAGCDSTINIVVNGLDVVETQIDTTLCNGDVLIISNMQITEEGSYTFTQVGYQGCDSLVRYNVSLNELPQAFLKLGSSCYIVASASAEVIDVLGEPPFSYEWSNGIIDTNKIENLVSGTYQLSITDINGCESVTQFDVDEFAAYQPFGFAEDMDCAEDNQGTFTIDSSFEGLFFSLDGINFQSELTFKNLGVGIHELFYKDTKACQSSFEFEIISTESIVVRLPQDTTIVEGESIVLEHQISQGIASTYYWYPDDGLSCSDCPSPIAQPNEDILYVLEIVDGNGCIGRDSIWIRLKEQTEIYIPNSFAPESINDNHRFTVFSGDVVLQVLSMEIYDTWGNLVFNNFDFESNDLGEGWDGKFKDKGLAPAVFVYIIEISFDDGTTAKYFGDLTLVR